MNRKRRRNPDAASAWWIFGVVAGAGALIAGVAYAASGTPTAASGAMPTPPPTGNATPTPPPGATATPPPQTIPLDATASGTTVQARQGDTLSIGLVVSGGVPWSYSYNGPSVTQGAETTSPFTKATSSVIQTNIFNAAGPGTSVISAHNSTGGTFSVTVVVS